MIEQGFDPIIEAADGDEALACQAQHHPELVLLDQVMRGRAGIDTARLLLARDPDVHVIMLTVVTDRETHTKALKAGIERVLPKADLVSLATALRELHHG
jgi:DNA-binding NarL/FixJ family response regulator